MPQRRPPLLAASAAALAAAALWSGAAAAQPGCASPYEMQPGDTLAQVAGRCGVTLDALIEANPDIGNPNRIAVGTELTLPGAAPADGQEGPGTNAADPATIAIAPLAGAAGTPVSVRGTGYEPGGRVTIGIGPPESEWQALISRQVRRDGTVDATVRVPDRSRPGDRLVFVIHTASGRTLVSDVLEVVGDDGRAAPAEDAAAPEAPEGDGDRRTVEGRLSAGTECPIVTTAEGTVYSLAGARDDIAAGTWVRVSGVVADMSVCMQGDATLDVRTMSAAEPPAPPPAPEDEGAPRLTRDYVLAPWAAKGGSCARPDFDITGNAAGGQVVETSLEGAPRTGYVRLGAEPALVFDAPRRELPLERRAPDGLAVMPPPDGPVALGSVTIGGDGVVFVRCPAPQR